MTRFGHTLIAEQSGPRQPVGYSAGAEDAGFDFLVCSDHYFPWLESTGHSPMPGPCSVPSPRRPSAWT